MNTTARAYRVAARDAVRAAERGENVGTTALETAKEAWADEYSQAQMALPKGISEIASALNRALGAGYSIVKQLPRDSAADSVYDRANAWFDGPLSDGVYLLRIALRHDLGVETQPDFEVTRVQAVRALDRARENLEHQLGSDRQRAVRSV